MIEQRYLPNATSDSRFFRWSLHPAHGKLSKFFSPVALSKYMSTMKHENIGVTCHMPTDFESHVYALTSSIFADKSIERDDTFYASTSALLSPSMSKGFDIYQHLKDTSASPIKNFHQTICRGLDGSWTSSVVIFPITVEPRVTRDGRQSRDADVTVEGTSQAEPNANDKPGTVSWGPWVDEEQPYRWYQT